MIAKALKCGRFRRSKVFKFLNPQGLKCYYLEKCCESSDATSERLIQISDVDKEIELVSVDMTNLRRF